MDANQHSEQLLPGIASVLAQANLKKPDVLALDIGPGAFTSVRVACGVAQGLALGWGCPVVAVQSLTALAQQALLEQSAPACEGQTVSCIIDARMGECYVARYAWQAGRVVQLRPPSLMAYDAILPNQSDIVIGNAVAVIPQWADLAGQVVDAAPSAKGVLAQVISDLAQGTAQCLLPEQIAPLYVRNQVAFTAAQRLAGLGK